MDKIRDNFLSIALVSASIVLFMFAETHVALFKRGFISVPFVLIVVTAVMYLRFFASIFAVLASAAGILYVTNVVRGHVGAETVFMMLEFLITAAIISVLTWHARKLRDRNIGMANSINALSYYISSMKASIQKDKSSIKKLKSLNKQLDGVVHGLMEDDRYWDSRMLKRATRGIKKKISNHP